MFFTYICHFNFAADVNKFRLSLSLPEDHPNRPHPALLNAIYCVSCHYSYVFNPDVKEFEPIFYDRAQRHLDDSLAHVDRLFDFLTATALLAQYNLMKGNLAKGTYLASCTSLNPNDLRPSGMLINRNAVASIAAMSFAVGCGLHQMNVNDPNGSLAPGMTLLPPPQSNAEYVERVNVFSTVFQVCQYCWSIPHSCITEHRTVLDYQSLNGRLAWRSEFRSVNQMRYGYRFYLRFNAR